MFEIITAGISIIVFTLQLAGAINVPIYYLNVLGWPRVIRCIRFYIKTSGAAQIFSSFLTMLPFFRNYVCVIIFVIYEFNSIGKHPSSFQRVTNVHYLGIWLFGGRYTSAAQDKINWTALGCSKDYILMNFNDFAQGLTTLYQLFVLNNINYTVIVES